MTPPQRGDCRGANRNLSVETRTTIHEHCQTIDGRRRGLTRNCNFRAKNSMMQHLPGWKSQGMLTLVTGFHFQSRAAQPIVGEQQSGLATLDQWSLELKINTPL